MADLSRLYFSVHPEPQEEQGNSLPTAVPAEVFSAAFWNVTGPEGEAFLDRVGNRLRQRGIPLLQACLSDSGFRVGEAAAGDVSTGAELASWIEGCTGLALVLLRFDQGSGEDAYPILRACDLETILTDGQVPSMAAAFEVLKRAGTREGGPAPTLLYRTTGGSLWDQIAPLRLAEAVVRFLNRRASIWYAGGPDAVARRLEGLASTARSTAAFRGGAPLLQALRPE